MVRLCNSIARVCGLIVTDPVDPVTQSIGFFEGLKINQTLALGCPLVVEALWERLGLRKTLQDIEKTAGVQVPYERALLAMVANRLCDPESKLGVWDRWLSKVYLPSCQGLKLRHMYEAMDLLSCQCRAGREDRLLPGRRSVQPRGGSHLLRHNDGFFSC